MKKIFTLVCSLLLTFCSWSQGLVEYYLMMMRSCNAPVAFIPDSLLPQLSLIGVDMTLANPLTGPVFDTTFSLSNTEEFAYLGSVTFDSADVSGASTYHVFRLLYDEYDSFVEGALLSVLNLSYDEWYYSTFQVRQQCVDCSLAPAGIPFVFLYSLLPQLSTGSYEFAWEGYDTDFHLLSPYRQAALSQVLNWMLDKPATVEDYNEVLNTENGNQAMVPPVFGTYTVPSCQVQQELLGFFRDVVKPQLAYIHREEDQDLLYQFENQVFEIGINQCIEENAFSLGVYPSGVDSYVTLFLPLNAGWPTLTCLTVMDGDSVYQAIAYSYDHQDVPGIVYEGDGEFSYNNGFIPADTAGGVFPFGGHPPVEVDIEVYYEGFPLNIFVQPATEENYRFYVNGSLEQDSSLNVFSSASLSNGDSLVVVVESTSYGCARVDTFALELREEPPGFFRSLRIGHWNDPDTWEASEDSVSWFTSNAWPDHRAHRITIQEGHQVSFPASLTELTLTGNLTVAGSLAYDTGSTTLLVFSGSTLQHVTAADTLYLKSITLDKATAGAGIVLHSPVVISDSLLLEKGRTFTTDMATLVLDAGSAAAGASDSSFVHGPVVKRGNTAFTFPVGKENYYRPVAISAPGEVTDAFTAEFFEDNAGLIHSHEEADPALASISRNEYWLLTRDSGSTSQVDITLSWDTLKTSCSFAEINDLRITGWDGTTWKNYGNVGSSGDPASGSIQNDSTIVQYGYFTLANTESLQCNCKYMNAVNLGENIFINVGDTVTIGIPTRQGVAYQWESFDTWFSDPDSSYTRIGPLASQVYKLTATHAAFCEKSDKITVYVLPDFSRCGNEGVTDTLPGTSSSASCACRFNNSYNYPEKSKKYHKLNYYVPDVDTENDFVPEKKIKINLHVLQLIDGDPGDSLYFPDTPLSRQYFGKVFNEDSNYPHHPVKEMYLQNQPPSDSIIPSHMELPSTRVGFELENVYFHPVDSVVFFKNYRNDAVRLQFVDSVMNSMGNWLDNNINYFLVNNIVDAAGVAVFPTPEPWSSSCAWNTKQYVFSAGWYGTYKKNNGDDSWTHQRHAAHELAHCLGLLHTYDATSCSYNNASNDFDWLDDLYSSGDLTDWNRSHPCPHPSQNHAKFDAYGDTLKNENGDPLTWGPYDNDATIIPDNRNTTNNIMGGQFAGLNFTPKQIGLIHRNFSLKSVRKYIDGCPYSSRPIEVDSNETWEMDIRVYNDIVVKSGNTLTVKCKIHFPEQASLIVEPGATLVVDGGVLTGACGMWRGIQLMGNGHAGQGDTLSSPQGVVRLYNATLENAEEGVFDGGSYEGDYPTRTGGIVRAYSTTFRNNWRSVCFNLYKYTRSSIFKECTFICDGLLKKPVYQSQQKGSYAHVTIWRARGIRFIDNTFENTIDYTVGESTQQFPVFDRTTGIGTYDAAPLIEASDPENGKQNVFKGLSYGLQLRITDPDLNYRTRCHNSRFENVQWGILCEDGTNDLFTGNTFDIPDEPNYLFDLPAPYGMYLYNYRSFLASHSAFDASGYGYGYGNRGLIARGYGYGNSSANIVRNTFSGTFYGFQAEATAPAVRLDCNAFTGHILDWSLFPGETTDPGILHWRRFPSQGTGCGPLHTRPGNLFLDRAAPKKHIGNNTSNTWTYFWRSIDEYEEPRFINLLPGSVNGGELPCGGPLDDPCPGPGSPPDSWDVDTLFPGSVHAIAALGAERDNALGQLNSIVLNGGQTGALMALINNPAAHRDTVVAQVRAHSPLDNAALEALLGRDSVLSEMQLFDAVELNLPCSPAIWTLLTELVVEQEYESLADTLVSLQVAHPGHTTPAALTREYVSANAAWLNEIGRVAARYAWQEAYDSLLVLYRDTLAGQGFGRELLGLYRSVDSLQTARALLDTMTVATVDDSLYVAYMDLVIGLDEDSLTWMELDSVQVQQLTQLSQISSSVQGYALAARALRGDTSYYRYPGEEYAPRLAERSPREKKPAPVEEPTFELYPNPHDGSFNLLLTGEKGLYRYRVNDLTGRLLVQEQFAKEAGKQTIPLYSPLSNGIYLLSVLKPDGTPAGVKRMFISR